MKDFFRDTLAQNWGGSPWPQKALRQPGCSLHVTLSVPHPFTLCLSTMLKSLLAFYSPINFGVNGGHERPPLPPFPTLIQQLLIEPFSPSPCSYQLTASFHVSQFKVPRENQIGQVHAFKPGHDQNWPVLNQVPTSCGW